MKVKVYLRVAQNNRGYKVAANTKPIGTPLFKDNYRYPSNKEWLPTVSFGLIVDVPDGKFNEASRIVGEINIADVAEIAVDVNQT